LGRDFLAEPKPKPEPEDEDEDVPDEEDEKKVKAELDDGNAVPELDRQDEDVSDQSDYGGGGAEWDDGDAYDFRADFNADDEGDMDAMLHDLDTTGHIKPKPDPSPIPVPKAEDVRPIKIEDDDDTPWASGQQLSLFRSNALAIADEYIKKSKIKFRKGPKLNGPNFANGGYSIYKQGKEDAKKIDVKRKRIKGAEQD